MSIDSCVLLVTDYIFDRTRAIVTTVALGVVFIALWYGLAAWGYLEGPKSVRRNQTNPRGPKGHLYGACILCLAKSQRSACLA